MLKLSMFLSCLAVSMFALGLSGCGGAGDAEQTPAASQPETGMGGDHAGDQHGEGEHAGHMMAADTEVQEALAELPEADRAAATAQKTCPVTDEPLGSMGKPFKLTVKDRAVFLCCEMCKDAVAEEPDKYLAKLDK